MIEKSHIESLVNSQLEGDELFLVGVAVSPSNEIEVTVDSDTRVDIDACVALSRAIEERLDRETEDFSLTVGSAGIGSPLKLLRQYRKLIGRPVDIIYKTGLKQTATLLAADDSTIEIEYQAKETPEGKKRPELVAKRAAVALSDTKSVAEHLDIK